LSFSRLRRNSTKSLVPCKPVSRPRVLAAGTLSKWLECWVVCAREKAHSLVVGMLGGLCGEKAHSLVATMLGGLCGEKAHSLVARMLGGLCARESSLPSG